MRTGPAVTALFLALGCAPPAMMRPPTALPEGTAGEIGGATVLIGKRPYVDEPSTRVGMAWLTRRLSENVTGTFLTAFDATAGSAGVGVSYVPLCTGTWRGGVQGELGLAWAALAVPVALQAHPSLTLYVAPRLSNWGAKPFFGAPGGLSLRVAERWTLRGEVQVGWADFAYYNRRLHTGLGVAHQF